MRASLLILISVFLFFNNASAQQNYCDFEGFKVISFGGLTGTLDSNYTNSVPNGINNSPTCASYIRDSSVYAYLKMYPDTNLVDITPWLNNTFQTPKIRMKLYSTAPPGTLVQIQLGISTVDNYPAGVHSEFMASTTLQYAWEELTFNYFQSPSGSLATPTTIDKIVLLFNPGSTVQDTFYFDDPTGPELISFAGIEPEPFAGEVQLYQNTPNPASEETSIPFYLKEGGMVSLNVYDVLGNLVSKPLNKLMSSGRHSVQLRTKEIPGGIYFYVLESGGVSQTMKMIVSK